MFDIPLNPNKLTNKQKLLNAAPDRVLSMG